MALNARSLGLIGITTACWSFSFGLGSQVVSHWLHAQDQSDTVIGLTHSFYYFGLAVGSCAVPALARRLGPAWCAALGMMFSGVALGVFPQASDEPVWYFLRFLNGWAGAMSLVPLETLISRDSAPEHKTVNFGIYGVSLTVGGAVGIAGAPQLYGLGYPPTFWLGAAPAIAAGCVLLLGLRNRPRDADTAETPTPLGLRRHFLSYGTAGSQGFLEGGMLAFMVLFLESRDLSTEAAGTLMGVTMLGVIAFQVPVCWLGDRVGKTPVLLACYGVVAVGLVAIPWLSGAVWLAIALFLFGACTGAMYPLGLSLLGERMPESGLARAYAWYLAIECVGSQAGAAVMGTARDVWGPGSMFFVGLGPIVAVLAVFTLMRIFQTRPGQCAPPVRDDADIRRAA